MNTHTKPHPVGMQPSNFDIKYIYSLILFILFTNTLFSDDILVRRIIYNGNIAISNREIQNVIITKEGDSVNRSIINDDAQRIYNLYLQKGFSFFKIHTPNIIPVSNRFADVEFIIEELTEPIIENIVFIGNSFFSESKIWELTFRDSEQSLSLSDLNVFIQDINDLYLDRGFLFVKIQLQKIEENNTAFINITEGRIVYAENFVFKGNEVTKDNILLSESRLQKGQVLTPSIIKLAEHRILSKQYIQSCSVIPINENTVLINVTEGKMMHLSAVLGYSSTENNTNSFNGFVNADILNIMGTDRNISFGWRNFDNVFSSVRIDYHESGHISIPIAADFRLYREERDSTSVRTEMGVDVYYQFRNQKYGVLAALNELYPGSRRPRLLEKQTENVIGFFYEGDFTDDIINPRSGWNIKYVQQYQYIHRESTRLQRHKFNATISNFNPLSRSWVVANSITGIYLENNSLTEFDLIRTGGAFSIRGFYEDFFAGNTIMYTNTELRYLLTRYSRVFVFLDYGYVEDNRPDYKIRYNDLIGLGFGLRAETRIGLLRIDYGFHHANNKWLNPLNGIIHFGIETSF